MSNSEIYGKRNAGMKQEISDLKNNFMKSLDSLKLDINDKFNNINDKLAGLEIIFLELSDKMSDGILLTIGHDRSLYLLFLLHQKVFLVALQKL